MDDIVKDSVGPRRFPTILLGTFALLALILAAVIVSAVAGTATLPAIPRRPALVHPAASLQLPHHRQLR